MNMLKAQIMARRYGSISMEELDASFDDDGDDISISGGVSEQEAEPVAELPPSEPLSPNVLELVKEPDKKPQ